MNRYIELPPIGSVVIWSDAGDSGPVCGLVYPKGGERVTVITHTLMHEKVAVFMWLDTDTPDGYDVYRLAASCDPQDFVKVQ